MGKPSYEELEGRVRELEQLVSIKVYPQAVHFETTDLLYFKIAKNWHFQFIDRKISDLTGYDAEDFLSGKMNWLDIVHEEDRGAVQDLLAKALKADKYYIAEPRIVNQQGKVRWVKMRGRISCENDGEFLSLHGVLNDITAQKYTELALESEHQAFAWMANNMEDGIYIVSSDYRIEFMNKALIDLVGDRVGEICYQALFGRDSVCPWSVMEAIRDDTCGFQEYQLPNLGKTFQVRSFPIKGRDGSIGKLGQLKDITKTKQLQYEVKEFAGRHQAIVDAANMADLGIFIIQDHEGMEARFRYTNEVFCRITGYTPEELLNKSAKDLVHGDDLEEAMERYRRRQRGEVMNQVYEIKLVRKDGVPITAFFSVAPAPSYEGKVATVGFVRDITERKHMQKSLLLSQRLASIGKLAAEIAHEINNPLTSVLTFSKLVARIFKSEPFPTHRLPEMCEYISHLDAEATRCANLARNLLDFSRHGDIDIKDNDIHELLEKTLDILRHRAALDQIRISTSFAPVVPRLSCDFKRLQQAFINIFWNAIEAMPQGGALSVSTQFDPERNRVTIEISDTGVGIPEEDLEKIFEPFFTTKAEGKGVGLGLSVAYGIIRQHHGEIRVHSELGKGTHFTMWLPTAVGVRAAENVACADPAGFRSPGV
jgi:PAS domain S-box-containing protein